MWVQARTLGQESVVPASDPAPRDGVATGGWACRSIWPGLKYAFFDVAPMSRAGAWTTDGLDLGALRGVRKTLKEAAELGDPRDLAEQILEALEGRPTLGRLMKLAYHVGALQAWARVGELVDPELRRLAGIEMAQLARTLPHIPHHTDHPQRMQEAARVLLAPVRAAARAAAEAKAEAAAEPEPGPAPAPAPAPGGGGEPEPGGASAAGPARGAE